ncbi:hypothetical protein B0H19DRAFT_1365034 [Mycena capillaripes]|nr:hypothetical protein B0H19DRAFT_1365034 [Mycena capillaripes]
MDDCGPPAFPVELEREIFYVSARSHPLSIPTLMLVAWRVKLWLEPVLYETIVLDDSGLHMVKDPVHSSDTLLSLIEQRPSFFRVVVRNLFILWVSNFDDAKTALSRCRSVENLWLSQSHTSPDLISGIEDLPLKRLHCSLDILFGTPEKIDFTHRLFARITHLELSDNAIRVPEHYCDLAALPNLSHLAFASQKFIPISPTLLHTCRSLRVLVFFHLAAWEDALTDYPEANEMVKDPRIVVTDCKDYVRDWRRGSHTGIDYWSRAEDLVAKRRSGKVDVSMITDDLDRIRNPVFVTGRRKIHRKLKKSVVNL